MDSVRLSGNALAAMSDGDVSEVERILEDHFVSQGLGHPGKSESRSWRHSFEVLARDLRDAGLGAVEVLAEHRLPLSSKRADVILAGTHPRTGAPSSVVVELKQWSTARRWQDSTTLVDVDGARYSPVLHASLQVAGYASYLTDFVTVLADQPDPIASVAYLHNATDRSIADLWTVPAAAEARMFTGQRRAVLHCLSSTTTYDGDPVRGWVPARITSARLEERGSRCSASTSTAPRPASRRSRASTGRLLRQERAMLGPGCPSPWLMK